MNIAKFDIKILAKWHITIGMYNQFAEYALTAKFQVSISPFFIQCNKIEVFFCFVYALRNTFNLHYS